MHIGSRASFKPGRSLKLGDGNTMRAVLTGLWGNGHQWSSPVSSLLRARCQAHKLPKTRLELVTEKGDRSVDPLGDDPIVVTGTANFSAPSQCANDENMLVIRGNTRVADIYFGEFMRIFDHFIRATSLRK